jgi:hypothetical protein
LQWWTIAMISKPLPLFDRYDIAALRHEREELLRKLRRGGMDVRSRIRTEQKAAIATAELIKLEMELRGSLEQ